MLTENEEDGQTIFISPTTPAAPLQALEEVVHFLVMLQGAEPGKRVEIGAEPVTIGRDAKQSLVLADSELSRRHARVSLINGEVMAEDLGSTNGTFVEGQRLATPVRLREGHILRIGSQFLKYERRSRRDVQKAKELDRDLRRASDYVHALLPAPITSGPVRTEWRFVPSTQLAGDAFGYYWLDADTFVFYLLDVSGHGAGSAMHSVAVMNVLRQRALPGVDFTDPSQVFASLNDRYQMADHNGLMFTMWYGVYRPAERKLTYGTAGHHAAYLVPPARHEAQPLGMSALMIGAIPGVTYETEHTTVPPGSVLHVFSDGVFEIVTKDEQRWDLEDFLPRLVDPPIAGTPEPERLYRAVIQAARPGPLNDDFSLLMLTFE